MGAIHRRNELTNENPWFLLQCLQPKSITKAEIFATEEDARLDASGQNLCRKLKYAERGEEIFWWNRTSNENIVVVKKINFNIF